MGSTTTPTTGHGKGHGIRSIAAGIVVGALAVLGMVAPAQAAVNFVDAPTRLYMLPNADGPLPVPIPFPEVPDGVLVFDDSTDLISQDLRKVEVVSEDPDCDFGPTYALTGCTAIQLDVGHGKLDFTTAPTRTEYDPTPDDGVDDTAVVYVLPGGALVRDMDSDDDLPALATAVIGTTAQVNDALDLLRYTPDEDYYYNGSNPETLSIDLVPGSGSGSTTHDIQIRVLDINDFPSMTVPDTLYEVDPGNEVVLSPDTAWEVTDEDNDERTDGEDPPGSGNDPIDGEGQEFILIAWSSCGVFHFQGASGFALYDDLQELLDDTLDLGGIDPAWRTTISEAFFGIIPDEIESLPFATGSPGDYASAFAGVVDEDEWLNYHLDEITFKAVSDPVANTPLSDSLCDIRFLVSDIGNNGLPLQYLGDPPEGVEVPFFGFDLDTNDVPGVEKVQVQVGDGEEIDVSLGDATVPEGGASTVPVTISPATHPAFDLTVSTADGTDAVADVDYTSKSAVTVSIPADATTATIPVDALQDSDYDPAETYLVTATGPVADPPGYQVSLSDPAGLVTIEDDDPEPDTTDPTVTIEQAVGQSDPTSTSPVLFDVVFDEPVTGFTNGDVVLSGSANPTTAVVTQLTASTYTVAVSGMTADGLVIAEVAAAAAEDAAGNSSEASTSTDNEVTFDYDEGDVDEPTVTINQAAGQADPTSTSPVLFHVVFSEPVTGLTNGDVVLSGSANPTTAVVTQLTTSTYTVAVSGMSADGLVIAEIAAGAAEDAAGNLSEASTSTDNEVTFDYDEGDVTEPTVTINQAVGQADPTSASPVLFDVVFSEAVSGLTNSDVVLSGSANPTTAVITPVTAFTYTVAVSGMSADGLVIAEVAAGAAEDAAGNLSEASTSTDNEVTFDIDDDEPTVTINQAVGQSDPTSTSPVLFDVVFNEPVTGLTNSDVVLSGSANPTTAVVTQLTTSTYTVAVSGMNADGLVIAEIAAGAAEDAAGNMSEASTSTDNEVTFEADDDEPTVTINQAVGQADPTSTSPVLFEVVFNEPVTGLTSGDIVLSGSANPTAAIISPLTPTSYSIEVTGMNADGLVIAEVAAGAAEDAAGNLSEASTSTDNEVTFDIDDDEPTVTINQAVGQSDPTSTSPVLFDVVFDEPVTGLTNSDVVLSGSANPTTAVVTQLTASTYTVAVSGMSADGLVIAEIAAGAAEDAAGNVSEASTSTDNEVTFDYDEGDVTDPTVTINQAVGQADPTSTSPVLFDVVFSEAVTGFTDADVVLSGSANPTTAVVTQLTTSTYTVAVSGMSADGLVIAQIAVAAAEDAAGNPSAASTSTDNEVTFDYDEGDVTDPTVTINQAVGQSDPTSTSPVLFDVVFSEAVTGFTDAGVVLSGSANPTTVVVTPLTTSTYTVAVSGMSADGLVIAQIAAAAAEDAAGNSSAASTSTDNEVTFDFDDVGPEPLAIQVPDDIVRIAPLGQPGVAVLFPAPTRTGGVEPVTIDCDHDSGEVYPIGVTTVTCTATDSAPIQTFFVVSASFKIAVIATQDPGGDDPGNGGTGGSGGSTSLPPTGADPAPSLWAGLALLLAGAAALVVARRRRHSH